MGVFKKKTKIAELHTVFTTKSPVLPPFRLPTCHTSRHEEEVMRRKYHPRRAFAFAFAFVASMTFFHSRARIMS